MAGWAFAELMAVRRFKLSQLFVVVMRVAPLCLNTIWLTSGEFARCECVTENGPSATLARYVSLSGSEGPSPALPSQGEGELLFGGVVPTAALRESLDVGYSCSPPLGAGRICGDG